MIDKNNYWNEFEYDKLKLLCHREKVQSIMDVYNGVKYFDNMPPVSVELHLTNNCNLHCPWCTDRDLHGNNEALSFDKICESLRYFGQQGTGVTLEGGGEPTIHPMFKEIVKYGYDSDVNLGLITNGTVDISEVINKFKWIRVSLDASNEQEYIQEKGKNLYDCVLDNLKRYQNIRDNKKCFLGVGYVLTTRNYSEINGVVSLLDKLGVDYIYFRPVEESPEITPSREDMYDLRKELLKIVENKRIKFMLIVNDRLEYDNANLPCVAHSLTSIIHANGDVVCCEKRRHDNIIYGNIYEDSFRNIWKSDKRIAATKKLLDSEHQLGCSVCRITPFNKIIDNLENMNTSKFI